MTNNISVIAIDAMGGDYGLESTVAGSILALGAHPNIHLILVGNKPKITQQLAHLKVKNQSRLSIHHAEEEVEMCEAPALALRNKKRSSMRLAINLVREGKAQACVSAGNTGALMATSRFVLKMLPGIDRPAIIYAVPGLNSETGKPSVAHMLDLGANVDCSSDHLFQFAVMGSVLSSCVDGKKHPRVALLNIGEEQVKGLDSIKKAAVALDACEDINYVGFIEGNHIFRDRADVIVCDGFIGNIALKSIEGAGSFFYDTVKQSFTYSIWAKVQALFARPALLRIKNRLDLRQYNGATFLGLRGIVIKSHGSADHVAFATAIQKAIKEIEKDVPAQIHSHVETILGEKIDA